MTVNSHIQPPSRSRHKSGISALLGNSSAMCRVRAQIQQICSSDAGVLIEGETGTGKELVSTAIHECSPRSRFALVPLNCGVLTQSLLESELFGHARGAFTGAIATKLGLFEVAHRGTLFLDEISTLPLAVQPSLLRTLECGEFRRLGETVTRHVDTRIIAATNVELSTAVSAGLFRQDLLYRLNTFCIALTPLRDRREDILLLATHFLDRHNGNSRISEDVKQVLEAHTWPGNVRELQHAVYHASIFANGGAIGVEHLPRHILGNAKPSEAATITSAFFEAPSTISRVRVMAALEYSGGRIGRAARQLGIGRTTMWRLMHRHDIRRG